MKYQDYKHHLEKTIQAIESHSIYQNYNHSKPFTLYDPLDFLRNWMTTGKIPKTPFPKDVFDPKEALNFLESPVPSATYYKDDNTHLITLNTPCETSTENTLFEKTFIITSFDGFDKDLGLELFSAYHEIGHALSHAKGLFDDSDEKVFMEESLADGFAMAYAISQGKDPEEIEKNVAQFRGKNGYDTGNIYYATFPIYDIAKQTGSLCQGQSPVDVFETLWSMSKDILKEHQHTIEKFLEDFNTQKLHKYADLKDFINFEDYEKNPNFDFFTTPCKQHIHSLKKHLYSDQEKKKKEIYKDNKDILSVCIRASTVVSLSLLVAQEKQYPAKTAYRPEHVLKNFLDYLPVENPILAHRLKSLLPRKETTAQNISHCFEKISTLLTKPEDTLLKEYCRHLAEICFVKKDPVPIKETSIPQNQHNIILLNTLSPTTLSYRDVLDSLMKHNPQKIIIVAPTSEDAQHQKNMLRKATGLYQTDINILSQSEFYKKKSSLRKLESDGHLSVYGNPDILKTNQKTKIPEK